MPKEVTISTLFGKFDVIANAPSSYEEGDALVGEVGGVLDGFIADCSARNFLPRLYKDVSSKLAASGHARATAKNKDGSDVTTKKTDGTVVPVLESYIQHVNRIHESGDEALQTQIGELLTSSASALPFYAAGERTGGGGKIAAADIDAANEMIADGTAEENVGIIESMVPGYKVARDSDGALTPESVARGIQRLNKHLVDEAKKKGSGLFKKA